MRRRRGDDEIHLYSGWDDSVVWFGVPIPYADTGLSSDLVAELEAWGHAMRELSGHAPGDLAAAQESAALREQISELARRLAAEVGRDFTVAVPEPRSTRRVHSDLAATNLAAARAFERLREREARWREEVRRVLKKGGRLHWNSSRDSEMP